MGLYVSTTGADASIPELGFTLTHPSTDYDLSAQFSAEDLKGASTLTALIRAGTLVWKKTSGAAAETPTDYDQDFVDVENENTGVGALGDRALVYRNVMDGSLSADLGSLVVRGLTTTNILREVPTITATTLNGTLTLTVASTKFQVLTGTAAGYSVVLPNATTLLNGWKYEISNTTNQTVAIKTNGGALLFTLDRVSTGYISLINNGTAAGTWVFWQVLTSSIASGIINYTVTSSTAFSSTNRVDPYQLITGFQVTPQAGTYACWYNASVFYTTTPKAHFWAFHKAGTIITDTMRQQDTAHSDQTMIDSTMSVTSFNGSETMDVRVKCANTGTLTVNARTMILIRIGA